MPRQAEADMVEEKIPSFSLGDSKNDLGHFKNKILRDEE
jgi:hypothetical protein